MLIAHAEVHGFARRACDANWKVGHKCWYLVDYVLLGLNPNGNRRASVVADVQNSV